MNTETTERSSTPVPQAVASGIPREERSTPTEGFSRLKNILVPVDFSQLSLQALNYAIPFARQFGATITLLHVIEPPACSPEMPYVTPLQPEYFEGIEEKLKDIRDSFIPANLPVRILYRYNFVFEGILEAALDEKADLIVTTTHGLTGLKHLLLGSTAENIVRKAPCPVLVVRETKK